MINGPHVLVLCNYLVFLEDVSRTLLSAHFLYAENGRSSQTASISGKGGFVMRLLWAPTTQRLLKQQLWGAWEPQVGFALFKIGCASGLGLRDV